MRPSSRFQPPGKWQKPLNLCAIDGCEKPHAKNRNVCSMHFTRKQAHGNIGDPPPAERTRAADGTFTKKAISDEVRAEVVRRVRRQFQSIARVSREMHLDKDMVAAIVRGER
jgi:hypothetical protein